MDGEAAMAFIRRVVRYKVPLLLGGISSMCIVLSIVLIVRSSQSSPIVFSTDGEPMKTSPNIYIDIEGAVAIPGAYTLPAGSRVEDAISKAGGLSVNADVDGIAKNINRAMQLTDGMKLYIPEYNDVAQDDCTTSGDVAQSCSVVATSGMPSQNGTIPVNSASQSELESLPGVGPVTAQKIIANRPYETLDDLVTKKAIGPSLFAKIKDSLSL